MAETRVFIDGFEHQDPYFGLWDKDTTYPATIATDLNGSCAKFTTAGSTTHYKLKKTFDSALAEVYCSATFKYSTTATSKIISLYNGATLICNVDVDTTNRFAVSYLDGASATQTASATADITSTDIGFYISLHAKFDTGGAGAFGLKINGTQEITVTGATTKFANADDIRIGLVNAGAASVYFDDFVVDNAGWPGVSKIQGLVPSSDGTLSEWTPSTGVDHWALVDETPPDNADYIYTDTVNKHDQFGITSLTGSVAKVKSVQVQTRLRTVGEPTFGNIAHSLRISATDYYGSDIAIPGPTFDDTTGYEVKRSIWTNSPATAAVFTEAEVNAMEVGIKTKA